MFCVKCKVTHNTITQDVILSRPFMSSVRFGLHRTAERAEKLIILKLSSFSEMGLICFFNLFFIFYYYLKPTNTGMTLLDLPTSLQLNIMQRLSDGRDLVSLGQVCPDLGVLTEDRLLWKNLCQYHFTDRQVRYFYAK